MISYFDKIVEEERHYQNAKWGSDFDSKILRWTTL